MQLSFMPDPSMQVLADDERGRIVYHRELFDGPRCAVWFDELQRGVQWRLESRQMYERSVDVPRLVATLPLDDPSLPLALRAMRPEVERVCGVSFTAAGLNLYRSGSDSVAPHGDKLDARNGRAPVALVSLGAVRRMTIRSRFAPRRVLDLDLEPGSLLVMSFESHFHYDHGIPKTRSSVGPRISVAFRRRQI
jgi:alkylated DNA repair dioxygenase AlkB